MRKLALSLILAVALHSVIERPLRITLSHGLFWLVDHNIVSDSDAESFGSQCIY